jgi:FkbM family methyltransferase
MKFSDGVAFPDEDDFMVKEFARTKGRYQFDHLDAAFRHVENFDVALDGGAHVGLWTRELSRLFRQVIAVEPSKDTCEALRKNVTYWGLTNVVVHRVALGREVGLVSMALDREQAARGNTGGRYTAPGGDVPRVTIDSKNVQALGFLKLDVEGSEYAALLGATETLARCRPVVLFEEKHLGERYYGHAPGATQEFLRQQGYRLLERVGCDEIWGSA